MSRFVDVKDFFYFRTIWTTLTMKDDKIKVIGTKVITKITNVHSVPWCKSRYGSDFKTKQVVDLLEKVKYIRKSDILPTQCYVTASFDFSYDDVKFRRIHLSQLNLFVENEQRKYPSITPANLWLLCFLYVVYLLNRIATESLGWKTSLEAVTGQKPNISAILVFRWIEPFYIINHIHQHIH
jgi:hypothetical protein